MCWMAVSEARKSQLCCWCNDLWNVQRKVSLSFHKIYYWWKSLTNRWYSILSKWQKKEWIAATTVKKLCLKGNKQTYRKTNLRVLKSAINVVSLLWITLYLDVSCPRILASNAQRISTAFYYSRHSHCTKPFPFSHPVYYTYN